MPSIGPRIGIQGEKEYRASLMHIISDTKQLTSEMDLLVASFQKEESELDKAKAKQEQYNKQIEQSKTQLDKFKDGLALAEEKNRKNHEALDAANKALEDAKTKYAEGSDELKKYEKAVEQAKIQVERSEKAVSDWKTKVNESTIELLELEKALKNTNLLEAWGEDLVKVGEKFSSYGEALTKYVTAPLTALGVASIKASSDFTDGMAKIYTIATENQVPMAQMRKELEQLSKDTAFSLDDLTESAYQAVSASVATEKATGFVADAARLARAGFTDTTTAVDLLTTAINAYGYEAEDASKISDILLKTQNDGKTIVAELGSTMGTVIPTAAAYNVSLENLAAAYVVMTKQGVNTARTTTFLNSMFTELERAGSGVSIILQSETGKSFAELMKEGKSLGDVLQILYQNVGYDSEAFAQLWKNVRAGRAGLALVNMGTDYFNESLERVRYSTGQTQYALDQLETPSLKAKRAVNQLKIVSVELGDSLIERLYPTFEKVVGAISNFAQKMMDMDDQTMSAIVTFGLATAAIGPFLLGVGKAITAVGELAKWFSKLTMLGQVTMLVAGLTAAYVELGAAAYLMQEQRLAEVEAEYGLSKAMKESIDTVNKLKQSHEEFEDSIARTEAANKENIATIEELVNQYNEQIDTNGKVKKGNENLAETILMKLCQAMDMERQDVEKLIEKNGKFGDSIKKNIDEIRKRAEMQVYEEKYTEAIRRKIEAQEEYDKQLKGLTEQNKKVQEAQDKYNKALEEYNKHLQDGTAKTGGYEDALERATEELATAKAAQGKLSDAVDDTAETIRDANNDIREYGGKMNTNMKNSTEKAAQGIEEGTPKVTKAAKGLATKVMAAMEIDGVEIGKYADQGFANGMDKYSDLVKKAAKRVANKAVNSMKSSLSISSPSKVTEELGEYTSEGFIIGMENMQKEVERAAANLTGTAFVNEHALPGSNNVTRNIQAPITVSVNVNGEVGNDYGRLADVVAERIAQAVQRREEVFA